MPFTISSAIYIYYVVIEYSRKLFVITIFILTSLKCLCQLFEVKKCQKKTKFLLKCYFRYIAM